MKTKIKNNKGITLIALIITIIIMLILVAVTINVVINSGLITSAKNAGDKTRTAYKEEGHIEDKIKIGEESLTEYIENLTGEVISAKSKIIDTCDANNEDMRNNENIEAVVQTKVENKTYEAPIPKGFVVSKADGETDINTGLVIYKTTTTAKKPDGKDAAILTEVNNSNVAEAKTIYDQFVWIPVEYTKTNEDKNSNGYDDGFDASYKRSDWSNNARSAKAISSSFKEPYTTEDSTVSASLSAMKTSVYKYGGFYIARYEAGYVNSNGVNTARTTKNDLLTTPIFRQDAYPYGDVPWGTGMSDGSNGAVSLSKGYLGGSFGAVSMLCSGVAWDCVLDFIKDERNVTSSSTWGNYLDSETFSITRTTAKGAECTSSLGSFGAVSQVAKNSDILLTTGATEINKAKNIYDIAGNCWEWTTEANESSFRVMRGGCSGNIAKEWPASCRNVDVQTNATDPALSFRTTIYVK